MYSRVKGNNENNGKKIKDSKRESYVETRGQRQGREGEKFPKLLTSALCILGSFPLLQ